MHRQSNIQKMKERKINVEDPEEVLYKLPGKFIGKISLKLDGNPNKNCRRRELLHHGLATISK